MSAAFPHERLQGVKVGVQPGVLRAVLQGRVPELKGAVCQGRDFVFCQGQHSDCLGRSKEQHGQKQWVEEATCGL